MFLILFLTFAGQRQKLKADARVYGGNMTQALDEATTHLIATHPHGLKYQQASERGLPVVTVQWLYESIRAHEQLPVGDFPLPANSDEWDDALIPPLPDSAVFCGCCFALIAFSEASLRVAALLVRKGMGTRVALSASILTHVIIGDTYQSDTRYALMFMLLVC